LNNFIKNLIPLSILVNLKYLKIIIGSNSLALKCWEKSEPMVFIKREIIAQHGFKRACKNIIATTNKNSGG
jgi:hypothetical protein